jgi:CheY-like chemotaxis protein/anti-sigma regulatory factor (Ser/Thr protein kinase)
MDADQSELQLVPVEINALCQASIQFIQSAAQKKRIRVYFTPDATAKRMLADELRLKQILLNLLGNAVKFTPELGAIGLEVFAEDKGVPTLHFVVWDTGVGIVPSAMEEVFRPFVQADSRLARQHEGSGLGLALVRRMVELHGGTVKVESQVERGSRFTVTLPWRDPGPAALPGATAKAAATHSPQRGFMMDRPNGQQVASAEKPSDPLILLVAQEASTLQLLNDYLCFKQYEVTVVADLEQAIASAATRPPAAIIVDLPPLREDDRTLCAGLGHAPHLVRTLLIALTAQPIITTPQEATPPMTVYLSKPVHLQELSNLIEQNLARRMADG